VIPDNFAIKIQGSGASPEAVLEVLQPLRDPAIWQAAETRQKLRSLVPEYRLSKFQQVLPDAWQTSSREAFLWS
jgi:ATP-dependent helicase Lhr and Lhr-like helicase